MVLFGEATGPRSDRLWEFTTLLHFLFCSSVWRRVWLACFLLLLATMLLRMLWCPRNPNKLFIPSFGCFWLWYFFFLLWYFFYYFSLNLLLRNSEITTGAKHVQSRMKATECFMGCKLLLVGWKEVSRRRPTSWQDCGVVMVFYQSIRKAAYTVSWPHHLKAWLQNPSKWPVSFRRSLRSWHRNQHNHTETVGYSFVQKDRTGRTIT